mmetsp:Transcript_21740/g.39918  ORF Transcript_21740/g.39918 Transcript_21740/m.39918 type:complete len:1643 (+) Transcript_21740:95-5023(+)
MKVAATALLLLLGTSVYSARSIPIPDASGQKKWRISSEAACKGKERELKQCDLPKCGQCIPANCTFSDWAAWVNPEDGTGLLYRSRNILKFNNECGEPCQGVLKETKEAPPSPPEVGLIPCVLGAWTEWSGCDDGYQQNRTRSFPEIPPQKFHAHGCNGSVSETRACNKLDPVDCELGSWTEWTGCSKSCGVGRSTRQRGIVTESAHGGEPCQDVTIEQKICGEVPCTAPRDCIFADWSDWAKLEARLPGVKSMSEGAAAEQISITVDEGEKLDSTSRFRKRHFEVTAYWHGSTGCEGEMIQTNGTKEEPPKPCPPQDWSEWSGCQSSCGAGQQFRRKGTCLSQALPKQETRPCPDPVPCPDHGEDCQMSDWVDWSVCDAKCGTGQSERIRHIIKGRSKGGEGCNATLKEVQGCEVTKCVPQDCKWADWADWDACSCSCGGGQKARSRAVLAAPRYGGATCPEKNVSEVEPCNTQSCDAACVDAVWGNWGNWGIPSASCGPAYHCRSRQVETEASWCGKPAEGDEEECVAVEGPEPCVKDEDCLLADWGVWSPCSCSCFGVSQRTRGIARPPTGHGEACEGNLTEVMQCNPIAALWRTEPPAGCNDAAKEKPQCNISQWSEWSQCTATCEGGFKMRNRMIQNEPCQANATEGYVLDEITGCENILCEATTLDCNVTEWNEWTACSSCGGNRYRTRSWKQDATQEGKLCDQVPIKEVSNCTDLCRIYSCKWSNWTEEEACTATCGASHSKLKRSLIATPVQGLVVPPAPVKLPPAKKPSGNGTGSNATGRRLANASKPIGDEEEEEELEDEILYVQEERFCTGTEVKLKACDVPECLPGCKPMVCTFTDWSDWAKYDTCGYEERHRHRAYCNECSVHSNATLSETRVGADRDACENREPVNCELGPWGAWSHCINKEDQMTRVREIQVHAMYGGVGCNGTLEETKGCGTNVAKDQECELSDWSTWGVCREVCENPAKLGHDDTGCPVGVQERTRTVLQYARGKGAPCNKSLDQVQTCPLNASTCVGRKIEHCNVSEWVEWGVCSAHQEHARTRSVTLEVGAGECGCNKPIAEKTECALPPVNCSYSEYVYSTCTNGHRFGHRQVHTVPTAGGTPCEDDLVIIEPCEDPTIPEIADCEFGEWSVWTPCEDMLGKTCGKGKQKRNRMITRKADYGGKPCSGGTVETRGCEGPKCIPDIDCEWYEWQDWHACTCTCGGGQKERSRHIKNFPSGNGTLCEVHDMKEAAPCNTQACDTCVNGTLTEWSDWGCCSSTCVGGVKLRSREVATAATSCGFPAEGLLQEVVACSVDVPCTTQECEFGDWNEWSACSKTCGGGHYRNRIIAKQGYGTGQYCNGTLEEFSPCNPGPLAAGVPAGCPEPPPEPVECVWEAWSEWSACSKTCGSGGQRYLSRRHTPETETPFSVMCTGPSMLAGPCEPLPDCSEALGQQKVDCQWSPWGEWGACTQEAGQRHRRRDILQAPAHGGASCVAEGQTMEAMQTDGEGCSTRDLSKTLQYCGWGDWDEWGPCDATCGSAVQARERSLGFTNQPPLGQQLEEENAALKAQLEGASALKAQHMAAAFCGGAATLVLVLFLFRSFEVCKTGNRVQSPNAPQVFSRSAYAQLNMQNGEDAIGARTLDVADGGLE